MHMESMGPTNKIPKYMYILHIIYTSTSNVHKYMYAHKQMCYVMHHSLCKAWDHMHWYIYVHIQDGAPRIAKLRYKWLNYVYGRCNYS
jgi:hypothetical protein